jgi:hypothetical protein
MGYFAECVPIFQVRYKNYNMFQKRVLKILLSTSTNIASKMGSSM